MRSIVIVGGGASGWSSAVALSSLSDTEVTLICDSSAATIGVGESTLPHLDLFHRTFGVNTDALLESVRGTPKFTIEFKDFVNGSTWYHPFSRGYLEETILARDIPKWLNSSQSLSSFVGQNFRAQSLRDSKFYAKLSDTSPKLASNESGLHLDSMLYGKYLKETALNKNVTYIDTSVDDVIISDNNVSSLILNNDTSITADIFIDCTGFNRTLISKLDGCNKLHIGDILKCDTALATQLPYIDRDVQEINSTSCTALSSGWVWQVPLADRIGIGYVHSSEFQDIDTATNEFKEYLSSDLGYNTNDINLKTVPFDTGRLENSWIGNTVAIGLSSGFIEPLESTGIALTHLSLMKLTNILSVDAKSKYIERSRDKFNKSTGDVFDEIKTFIEFHYLLSDRDDSQFWNHVASVEFGPEHNNIIETYTNNYYEFRKGDSLAEAQRCVGDTSIFSPASYLLMLIGYRIYPNL